MTDPRAALSDPRLTMGDPRMSLSEPRVPLTVCTCGLPNCPRVGPHAGAPHPAGFSPEGHYPHGLPAPLGSAPVGHIDPTVLYSMQGAYGLKEGPEMLRALPQLNGYYPYDPTSVYPYMNGYGGIDARRKNATKESTNTLKAWLFEHRKNPYPTKGEKIMLAILTKMTLTQVSTWFANARRRLKKENKMTWTSKDDIDGDDEDESEHSGDVMERANVSAASGSTDDGRQLKGNGSVGDDDDDVLSVTSVGDRSEIDVEDHSDISEDHRIPTLLPHTLGPNGPHHMFLANHGPHVYSPLMTSLDKNAMPQHRNGDLSGKTSGLGSNQSQKQDSTVQRPLSPISPCESKCNHVATITPPPSPKDTRVSESSPSSRMTSPHAHRSSATIHHHPVTTSPRHGRVEIPAVSEQSPSKPKIWSIADVVSNKDSNDNKKDNSKSHSNMSRSSQIGNSPPAIVTIGGAPSRMDHIHRGMPYPHAVPGGIPGSEPGYSLAYYPYGLPNPAAAAAIMASQASNLASRVHPYTRLGGFPGHHSPNMPHHFGYTVAQSRSDYHAGLPNVSRPSSDTHMTPSVQKQPGSLDSHKALDTPSKPGAQRPVVSTAPSNCTPTAFTPVVQRQM